jgi:hypothetical protein
MTGIKGMSEMRRHVLTFAAIVISGTIVPAAMGLGSALAFTETPMQQSGGQQQAPLSSAAPIISNQGAPSVKSGVGASMSLTDPVGAAGKSQEGAEIKIPGIGAIGTLPKLNFGLELLYGSNGDGPVPEKPMPSNEDVLIKGTLKHQF